MATRPNNEFYPKLKATLITALIAVWCLFFARYITWDADIYEKDPEQELLMEVDLGDLDQASLGNNSMQSVMQNTAEVNPSKLESEQVEADGDEKINYPPPSPTKTKITPPQPKKPQKDKPPKIVSVSKPVNAPVVKIKEPIVSPKIVAPPVPKAILSNKFVKAEPVKTPNAVFSRGTSSQAAAGKQGATNGHEGAKPLFGNSGASGINVAQNLRNRGILQLPKFNEKFNENASFRVEIKVSKEGSCSFLRIMRTNSSSPNLLRIVRKKITELRFKPSQQEDIGYIDFVFKVVQ